MEIYFRNMTYFPVAVMTLFVFIFLFFEILRQSLKRHKINTRYFYVSIVLCSLIILDTIYLIMMEFTNILLEYNLGIDVLWTLIGYFLAPIGIAINFIGGIQNRFNADIPIKDYKKYKNRAWIIGCGVIAIHALLYIYDAKLVYTGFIVITACFL